MSALKRTENRVSLPLAVVLSLIPLFHPHTYTDGRVEIKESDDQKPVETAWHSGGINGLSVKNCRFTI